MTKQSYRYIDVSGNRQLVGRLNKSVGKLEGRMDRAIQRIRNIEKLVAELLGSEDE